MRAILIFGAGILVGFALAHLVDNGVAIQRFEAALTNYNSCYQHVNDGPQWRYGRLCSLVRWQRVAINPYRRYIHAQQ